MSKKENFKKRSKTSIKNRTDNSRREDNKEKSIQILNNILQSDNNDMDFELYRILNVKKKEIAKFIEKNLYDLIAQEFDIVDSKILLESPIESVFVLEIQSDILNHLINFLSYYYNNGNFIPKRRYFIEKEPDIHHSDEILKLYWANYDQYYVQNVEPFNNYNFRNDYENLTDNPIKSKTHNITQTINNDITKNSTDYFIHKDLKGFLTDELDFYIKNEILEINTLENNSDSINEAYLIQNIKKIKIFKSVSTRIIKYLARIEEIKKKLWEKPKFVLSNEFCLPLDMIDNALYKDIFQNMDQLEEWKRLFNFTSIETEKVFDDPISNSGLNEKYKKLPVDSKFFDDNFKQKLIDDICKNDRLDSFFDGTLILSDNFHALKLLQSKFSMKIKCIYIDPPYNTESDNFVYGDKYKSGSWITMMKNQLILASKLLHENGTLCISIDDNELHNLLYLVYGLFGKVSCKTIAVKVAEPTGVKMAHVVNSGGIAKLKEYLILVKKNGISDLNLEKIPKENWDNAYNLILTNMKAEETNKIKKAMHKENPTLFDIEEIDEILKNFQLEPLEAYMKNQNIKKAERDEWKIDNAWRILRTVSTSNGAKKIADKKRITSSNPFFSILTQKNKVYLIKNDYDSDQSEPRIKLLFADDYLSVHPGDFWYDIKTTGLDKEGNITFKSGKKPEKLLKRIITMTTNEGDTVLDFFVGSGTSAAVAHKLKRKWIGVETDPTIYSIVLERMKHVIFGENFGISKNIGWKGGGLFRYLSLEQYQDSLQNLISKNYDDITVRSVRSEGSEGLNRKLDPNKLKNNVIRYIIDFNSNNCPIFMNSDSINNPFNYYIKIRTNKGIKIQKIDLVETFNYIAGITVNSISQRKNGEILYVIVKGFKNEKNVIVIWRNKTPTFDLKKDKEFIESKILQKNKFDEILINGTSLIENAISMGKILKERMFL